MGLNSPSPRPVHQPRLSPTRIRPGTGTVIAPFWHPVKLAGEAAITDLATVERLDLGIARGAYSFEYERLDAWPRCLERASAPARDNSASWGCGKSYSAR